MRVTSFFAITACLAASPAAAQPILRPGAGIVGAATTLQAPAPPPGARPLACRIVLAGWTTPRLEIRNAGPAKVDAGETVAYRAAPGGQGSTVIGADLGAGETMTANAAATAASTCIAYVLPRPESTGRPRLAVATELSTEQRQALPCYVVRPSPLPTTVQLVNSGTSTLRRGSRVGYAFSGSGEVWHMALDADVAPGVTFSAPYHSTSNTCRGWVGE